jgi:UDP-glucose 4-epimerase
VLRDGRFQGVIHAAALHRPQQASMSEHFEAVNVGGTRNMLEMAAEAGVSRFVYTSTTAVMTDQALADGGAKSARWFTETETTLAPYDTYGRTKLAAEDLCRALQAKTSMSTVILRPSRFFHRDLLEHSEEFTQANHRANEFLFRRASVDDVAMAHALAIEKADQLVSELFIVSAPSPFTREDCELLMRDAPAVVARYFPDYEEAYVQRGWKMYRKIDRVYVSHRVQDALGLRFTQTFADQLR